MKAAVVPAVGQRWELREVATPRPGPGQVLVRVHACGVCHNDVWLSRGVLPFPPLDPVITGHEAVGEVVEAGPGVTARRPGDRVGVTWVQGTCGRCAYCRRGLPLTGQSGMNCAEPVMTGVTVPGGHAEYVVALVSGTVPLPDELDYETAAPLLCAGYTAWSALRASRAAPRERVAVLGLGGVGHLAVQYARACGFETVAVTRSAEKQELARKLGAALVVADGTQLRESGGADVLLVTGTSYAAAGEALAGVRPNGRVVLAGIDPQGAFTIGPRDMVWANRLQIVGSTHNGPQELHEALRMAAEGAVTPLVETFDREQVAEAVDAVERNEVRFRAVVRYA
ncbi:alcohol dehydrogenase catalytic domain-containing protein [Actinoplanes siamensis]|uniref:alcohol dehydrogenase n=1 Tax=Actinoplanes siamensis TaxID=1223317 RepID=A0A919TLC8_9ACTN|nr:alcohol dehydrogenase catalytic domain-containing protein [Actinoplanes siamensis]GIF07041.1 alcohol dehydrogenase [Actinoplanes siamensis]